VVKKGLSPEGLKLIACGTMLLDHIGLVYSAGWMRYPGRLAFPIYCFLLTEGARHTCDSGRYGVRLLLCALISELPFDMMLFGSLSFERQNTVFTLLLGFAVILAIRRLQFVPWKILLLCLGMAVAEYLRLDYGAPGIALIAVFFIADAMWLQMIALFVFAWISGGGVHYFAVLSIIPIALYSGKQRIQSPVFRRMLYLFYPVHLLILGILKVV